jgi:hypothetical protein
VSVAMERLRELDDSQSAMFLLRTSYGIVRATHFMRTTPLTSWRDQAQRFDCEVRKVAEDILGVPLDDRAWTQATLTPSLGGLVFVALLTTRTGLLLLAGVSHRGQLGSLGYGRPRQRVT